MLHSFGASYRFHTKMSLFKDRSIVVNDFKHYPRKIKTTNNWDKYMVYVIFFYFS